MVIALSDVTARVARERREQGLPPEIKDPVALAEVARLLLSPSHHVRDGDPFGVEPLSAGLCA
jgi:hypothetical protein